MDEIKQSLRSLVSDINLCLDESAIHLYEDGIVTFECRDGYNYTICRTKKHDWQEEMAKDLVEQEDEETD